MREEVEHIADDEAGQVLDSIEWFAPQRPVSGTVNLLHESEGEHSDRATEF